MIDFLIAYLLDLCIGDPHYMPHPVRFIGQYVRFFDRKVKHRTVANGVWLMLSTVCLTAGTIGLILWDAKMMHPLFYHVLNIYFIYTALATRCLSVEAKKVYNELADNDLEGARAQIAMLVGRDTTNLNVDEITCATVETVAENTVDGVASPMFYALLGGLFGIAAPLAYAFKAVSTLDSMVGYKNEKYLHLGKCSALTDDVLNYIPARITAGLMVVAAGLTGLNVRNCVRILCRDRRNHKSPNCAYPEAAIAGALGVQLGGDHVYFGEVVQKPTIGDATRAISPADIIRTNRVMFVTSFLIVIIGTGAWYFVTTAWR
ncbi:MAG: cobalamin biosynthesis protein CobD [Hyphomonadaceae bacterium]|nr:cobalamin biosynthesis protein CobD [Clostridia bacterium]